MTEETVPVSWPMKALDTPTGTPVYVVYATETEADGSINAQKIDWRDPEVVTIGSSRWESLLNGAVEIPSPPSLVRPTDEHENRPFVVLYEWVASVNQEAERPSGALSWPDGGRLTLRVRKND